MLVVLLYVIYSQISLILKDQADANSNHLSGNLLASFSHDVEIQKLQKEIRDLKEKANQQQQQQQQQQDVTRTVVQDNKELPLIQSCPDVLQRMLDWNDCWWHFVNQHHHHEETVLPQLPPSCPITTNNNINANNDHSVLTEQPIGSPLLVVAYYEEQGFGRVIEHTADSCMAAFVLGRPCLVDMSPRDPFYTWRSFLQENSYRWEPARYFATHSALVRQVDDLVQQLHAPGANDWQQRLDVTKYDTEESLVFPMDRKFPTSKETIDYYHAMQQEPLSPRRGRQVLVSPNWGTAWFQRIKIAQILKDTYNCDVEEMRVLLEAAMYRPTAMTWQLHVPRYNHALQTAWATTTATTTNTQSPTKSILPRVFSDRITTTGGNNTAVVPYGTIHVRLYFINTMRENQKQPPIGVPELAEVLQSCLQQAMDSSSSSSTITTSTAKATGKEFPTNWWFLGDNASMTAQVAEEITNQQRENRQSAGKNLPRLSIFHDYNVNAVQPSKESRDSSAQAMFGHSVLAGSIQDWMALHQSNISIVMRDGSFGKTGARGNGKVGRTDFCGRNGGPQLFQIFEQRL